MLPSGTVPGTSINQAKARASTSLTTAASPFSEPCPISVEEAKTALGNYACMLLLVEQRVPTHVLAEPSAAVALMGFVHQVAVRMSVSSVSVLGPGSMGICQQYAVHARDGACFCLHQTASGNMLAPNLSHCGGLHA